MSAAAMDDPAPVEIAWYRQHGRHPDRISRTADGREFVIGDKSWNSQHPDRREVIEPQLNAALYATQAATIPTEGS